MKKRLLIITQKVDMNDQVLGFFHSWLKEFSSHYEKIEVICLEEGKHNLPLNIKVHSLGKEKGRSKIKYLYRFYKYMKSLEFDQVFVHMNQIYVLLAFLLRIRKPIYLWYTHKKISLSLITALFFVKKVFTASKDSFRIPSKKVEIVGHGIDTSIFTPGRPNSRTIISIGRISKTKNQLVLIKAFEKIKDAKLIIVGAPITKDDFEYEKEIKEYIKDKNINIDFVGSISPKDIVVWYQKANIFINLSNTGSLDKAVLEAMSCGLNVITSNEAFKEILEVIPLDEEIIVNKINSLLDQGLDMKARQYIIENHNIKKLIPRLVEKMS